MYSYTHTHTHIHTYTHTRTHYHGPNQATTHPHFRQRVRRNHRRLCRSLFVGVLRRFRVFLCGVPGGFVRHRVVEASGDRRRRRRSTSTTSVVVVVVLHDPRERRFQQRPGGSQRVPGHRSLALFGGRRSGLFQQRVHRRQRGQRRRRLCGVAVGRTDRGGTHQRKPGADRRPAVQRDRPTGQHARLEVPGVSVCDRRRR